MKLPCFLRSGHCRAFSACFTLLILTCGITSLFAQQPSHVVVSVPPEVPAGSPVQVSAELLRGETVHGVYLLYRSLGKSQYSRLEMDLRGTRATVLIPAADVIPPVLEFYLVLQQRTGTLETHPVSAGDDPFGFPPENVLRLPVRPPAEIPPQALLLSPEAGVPVAPEDLVISVSLLRADSTVDRRASRLFVDGSEVTADAVFSDDMLIYVPANFDRILRPGEHSVTVELVAADGSLLRSETSTFSVTGETVRPTEVGVQRTRLSVQLESRREGVAGGTTWYNRGGYQFSATSGLLSVRSNVFLTSDEKSERQPQNRFFIGAALPWISAGYGDAYPSFSRLILSGRRVRGLLSSLTLGWFNVDLTLGQTERPVDGRLLGSFSADSLAAVQAQDPGASYAPLSSGTWGKILPGTYERKLFAVRPSFGSGRSWRLGFTWLKAKDDVSSIRYGVRPQENLVVGTDLVARLFDEAVEIFGEGAFSAFNTDISSGNFTDAHIDSVYPDDASSIKSARDILDRFITVNDNLRPLSLKTPATLAYEAGIALNVLSQALRVSWLYRGSDYYSFGQSFLRRDLRGITATDRLRLIGNQVFLSLSYERLKDNTSKTKPATTTFTTAGAALSYYPDASVPSLTVGYGYVNNRNTLPRAGSDSLRVRSAVDELGNRFFVQSAYSFQGVARHSLSGAFSVARRDDRSIRSFDVNDLSASLAVTTAFPGTIETSVEFLHNRSERPSVPGGPLEPFRYSTMTFGLRYALLPDVLLLRGVVSPTYGDLQRTLIGAGVDITVMPSMTLQLEYSGFRPDSGTADSIWDLQYRYDL